MNNPEETWAEYRRLVLAELERLNNKIETLEKEAAKRDVRQAMLTAKLTVYVAIGSVISGALGSFILDRFF